MPTTSAAIPIIGFRSFRPNLLVEFDLSYRAGGERQVVGYADVHHHPVGRLQDPQALQTGTLTEGIVHPVRRPDGPHDGGVGDRLVVDEEPAACLPHGDVGSDADAADG